jgi:hypothetical protein
VPLNLFPTSSLKSVLVQKTYSPNLPGEFGGGIVDLRTKAIPDEAFLTVDIGADYVDDTTWKNGLLYDGGAQDWTGFDDGTRDRPSIENGLTTQFGSELTDNSSLLVMQRGEVAPNFSGNITGGDRFDLSDDISMGVIGSFGYGNSWVIKNGRRGYGFSQGDGLGVFYDQARSSTQNTIDTNALATVGFDLFSDHEIKFTGLVTRSTEKEARIVEGFERRIRSGARGRFGMVRTATLVHPGPGRAFFPGLARSED